MPDQVIKIAKYTYHFLASRDEEEATIYLYDDAGTLVGRVAVVPDNLPMPPAERRGRRHKLYYRRETFRDLVDMLRHEGPVYLVWRDGANAALGTGLEPVGEAENAALAAL